MLQATIYMYIYMYIYMDLYIWIQINAIHMDIAKGNKTAGLLATDREKLSQKNKKRSFHRAH